MTKDWLWRCISVSMRRSHKTVYERCLCSRTRHILRICDHWISVRKSFYKCNEMVNTTKVRVIEQNGVWWWNGTGTNAIRLKEYPIKNTVWRYRYRPSLSNQEEIVIDLILHNNGKLYGITKDPWLKDLLAQTNQKIRNLYR